MQSEAPLKFQEKLQGLLRNTKYFIEGELNKSALLTDVLTDNEGLISLLLKDPKVKEHFFRKAADVTIFQKEKFIDFIQLKEFLPNSYTAFSNKIGLALNGKPISKIKDVVLDFPYKDCVLEGGQDREDQKRDEIFYNETLSPNEIDRLLEPKAFTNFKRYDKKGEHQLEPNYNFGEDNLIIKGNNLLALHSLLGQYRGKVKLVYIDPPYNTGNGSFHYNDSFNHSTWLTFMKNRLEVARELLRDDGVIFVQCDDNEQAYLRVLMDETFRSQYLYTLYIQVRYSGKTLVEDMDFQKLIELVHVYSKTSQIKLFKEEVDYSFGAFMWKVSEKGKSQKIKLGNKNVEIFLEEQYEIEKGKPDQTKLKEIWASGAVLDGNSSGRFFRDYLEGRYKEDGYGVLYKVYGIGEDKLSFRYFTGPKKEGSTKGKYYQGVPSKRLDTEKHQTKMLPIENFYNLADAFGNCRLEGGVSFRNGRKPEELLNRIIEISTQPNDIILDYHLGSGTTAAVAHKMGRRYIGIEQMSYIENVTVERLKKVIGSPQKPNGKMFDELDYDKGGISESVDWRGGGSFTYIELAEFNQAVIERIQSIHKKEDLLSILEDIKQEKQCYQCLEVEMKEFDHQDFSGLTLEDQKKILIKCLDKNHLYVNLSDMKDTKYGLSPKDVELNKAFYREEMRL